MMEQYIECDSCRGSGCVDYETGQPTNWESVSAVECADCDGSGSLVNSDHEHAMRLHLKALLESGPFRDELENANYHSATRFLEELRDNPW